MTEARTTPQDHSPSRPRAERHAAALVAQYLHELSDRHAQARQARAAEPETGDAAGDEGA